MDPKSIATDSNFIKYDKIFANFSGERKSVVVNDQTSAKVKCVVALAFLALTLATIVLFATPSQFSSSITTAAKMSILIPTAVIALMVAAAVFHYGRAAEGHSEELDQTDVNPNALFKQILSIDSYAFAEWKVALFEKWGKRCTELDLSDISIGVTVLNFLKEIIQLGIESTGTAGERDSSTRDSDYREIELQLNDWAIDKQFTALFIKLGNLPNAAVSAVRTSSRIKTKNDLMNHRLNLEKYAEVTPNGWDPKNVVRILNSVANNDFNDERLLSHYNVDNTSAQRKLVAKRSQQPWIWRFF